MVETHHSTQLVFVIVQLLVALRNAVARLAADFEDSKLFTHLGDRGEFREKIVEQFLRPFLPRCYGLGSGAVFDRNGQSSRQIDVVIYDEVFSNVLFRDNENSLFPCESVFGNVEVKSQLSTAELDAVVKNVASVKCLSRAPSDMMDVLPFRRIKVGDGLSYDRSQRNPYLGIVFAYDGLVATTTVDDLNGRLTNPNDDQLLPDFLFDFRREYMVMRCRRESGQYRPVPPGTPFDRFAAVATGADTLPLFFLTTNVCLNQIILRAPDFNQYWIQALHEVRARST